MTAPVNVDAVWNAVAVASVGYQRERLYLIQALTCGRRAGLGVLQLVEASGLPTHTVLDLLLEADDL